MPSSSKFHFLFINQFYPPDDAPTGRKLHDLAKHMVQRGHDVEVICSSRPYGGGARLPHEECMDGVNIHRLGSISSNSSSAVLKMFGYAEFYTRLAFRLTVLSHRPDLLLNLTTPPFLGIICRFSAARNHCKRIEWIMDLYPDVMVSNGMIGKTSLLARLLGKLARMDMKGADKVITLSAEMADKARAYHGKVTWLPLWGDDGLKPLARNDPAVEKLRKERGWTPNELVLLYSGNMGRGHCFDEFLHAALKSGPDVRWVFCGKGVRRLQVETFIRNNPQAKVELLPLAPLEILNEHLCAADVHLVSVRKEWNGTLTPSKAVNSFATGRPILFVGPASNSLAAWIGQCGVGWVIDNDDADALAVAVADAQRQMLLDSKGMIIRSFYDANLSAKSLLNNMADLLDCS